MITVNIHDVNLKSSWPDVTGKARRFGIDFSTPS